MKKRRIAHWSKMTEVGSAWGINFTFALYRLLGRRVTLWLLHPIVAWFFLFVPSARAASKQYLTHLQASGGFDHPPTLVDHYRHLYAFAVSALDKVAAWMQQIDPARVHFANQTDFATLSASVRGAVVIGSHLGNLEMARALASMRGTRPINAIVYTDHAVRFNEILARANPGFSVNLIQVYHLGPDTAIDLAERVGRGELLFIVGDRTPPAENARVSVVDFLGAPAPFAQGPFILASVLDCPVYLFFCLAEGERYCIYFEHFADRIRLPRAIRAESLRVLNQRYADRLAHYCRIAPLQWFNFFDFWRR